jgi:hypothetical protein
MTMMFNNKFLNILPEVLVDEIADYHNYDKYCKSDHKLSYKSLIDDIISMSNIMSPMSAKLAKMCWGSNTIFDINTIDNVFDQENQHLINQDIANNEDQEDMAFVI